MGDFTHGRPIGSTIVVAFDSSTQSTAIPANVFDMRLLADQACYVIWGVNPTALNTGVHMPLAAGVPEYFKVVPGEKVAAIKVTTAGNLSITPMSG